MFGLLENGDDETPQPPEPQAPPMQAPPPPSAPIASNPTNAMPAPQASQMPQQQAPPRPSLMARIGHALSAAGGAVSDHIRPEAPGGYEGLLSPDEIKRARPSLLHSLIGGPDALSAEHQYSANLDNVMGHKQLAVQVQRQNEIMQSRQDFMRSNPMPPPNASEADIGEWMNRAYTDRVQNGDFEAAKSMQPLVEQFAKNKAAKIGAGDAYVNAAGQVHYFDKSAGSDVPAGWKKLETGSAGSPILFTGTKNGKPDYQTVNPNDAEKMAGLVSQGYKPDIDERTQFVQNMQQGRFDVTDVGKQVAAFDKLNAPIAKAATFYPGFKAASEAALAGNPASFKTMMSQMAAQLDPALQLRLGTLLYVQNIDPSFKGSLQRYLSEKSAGTLPPDQVRKVIEVVDAVRKEQRQLYEDRRNDLITNFPAAAKYAHDADYVFGTDNKPGSAAAGTTTSGAGTHTTGYSPNNPFVRKK